ncbi:MAG: hypothetical protein JSR46_09570 [Verrucomicrobia bacterium]|nr:hypothetical protein [Verrucomicrobiota bacterium]
MNSLLIDTNCKIFIYEFKEYMAQVTYREGTYPVKFKIKFNDECEIIGTRGCSGDARYTYHRKGQDVTREEPRYLKLTGPLRDCSYQESRAYWKSKGVNDITFTIPIRTEPACEVTPPIVPSTKNENIPLEVKNMAEAMLEKLNEFYTQNPKLFREY